MLEVLTKYLPIIGSIIGLFKLKKIYTERYRTIIHDAHFSGSNLEFRLENPSNNINSLEPTIYIDAIYNGKNFEEQTEIQGSRELKSGKELSIRVPCSSKLVISEFITITISPTKSRKIKIRFRYCTERYNKNFLMFWLEKTKIRLFHLI